MDAPEGKTRIGRPPRGTVVLSEDDEEATEDFTVAPSRRIAEEDAARGEGHEEDPEEARHAERHDAERRSKSNAEHQSNHCQEPDSAAPQASAGDTPADEELRGEPHEEVVAPPGLLKKRGWVSATSS